jgi:magnesium-transporting ATPase (P-type)
MIRLYQDNGEVVAVVGSSLKVENMEAFLAADLAFSVRPRVALRPSKVTEFHQQNNVLLAGKLISAPCTLTSNFSSEYFSSSLIQKILVARLIYINSQQAVLFTAHAAALLVMSQFFCCVVQMPSLLSAGYMGFMTIFLIPALSASCLLSPDHDSFPVIKRIPDKQNDDDQGTLLRKQHMCYYSLALVPPSAFLVFITQAVSLIDPASASGSDIFARHVFPAHLIEQAQVRVQHVTSAVVARGTVLIMIFAAHLTRIFVSAHRSHMAGCVLPRLRIYVSSSACCAHGPASSRYVTLLF